MLMLVRAVNARKQAGFVAPECVRTTGNSTALKIIFASSRTGNTDAALLTNSLLRQTLTIMSMTQHMPTAMYATGALFFAWIPVFSVFARTDKRKYSTQCISCAT
ncbi:hypothetical protein [Burkholderia ubonensis]|uniref:hypothetical protein n=1 Tax=Burkholderia ubonensis TaxID=101571 RepID=UPI000B2A8AEC|nr:hypothetical protein [Burkholderia ubonensis]